LSIFIGVYAPKYNQYNTNTMPNINNNSSFQTEPDTYSFGI